MKIDILGTEYDYIVKNYDEEEAFERREIAGYCDGYAKEIVICEMSTYKGWEHETAQTLIPYQKASLRHEIIHAFLFESGLASNTASVDAWAANEEMVDWIALKMPMMIRTMQLVDAL